MTTVYFAGTEDVSFTMSGNFAGSNASSSYYRTAFSRAAIGATGSTSSTTVPPSASALTTTLGSISNFWVHGYYYCGDGNLTTASAIMIAIADSGGVIRLLVRGTGTTGQLKISTRNAAGTIVDLVTSAAGAFAFPVNPVPIDLFINYSTTGRVTLYCNGVSIADTGSSVNVTTDSATTLSNVYYACAYNPIGILHYVYWSECLIQDTSTLGCAVQTLPPVASGNTQSWLPNTVGDINPAVINDANFIASTVANQLSEWTLSTSLPEGNWSITAIVQAARVTVGTSGPLNFEWLIRTSDGSDHVTGSVAPLTSFQNFSNVWATNPHTSAAWNAGELINAGIESLT